MGWFKMESEIYQTHFDYTLNQIEEIEGWCDDKLGTETEISDGGEGYYLMAFDLTMREVQKFRDFENMFRVDMKI